MGRGNARFCCPKGTQRADDHSAIHRHVYVDYDDINDQEGFDLLNESVALEIRNATKDHAAFEYPKDKYLDREIKIIAENDYLGVGIGDNETSLAVFVYAKEDTSEEQNDEHLDEEVHALACRVFWQLRHFNLRQRNGAWCSKPYAGTPTST